MRRVVTSLLLIALCPAQVVVRRGPITGATGITVTNLTPTVQASGHTCTISSVTLATGNSIAAISMTTSLAGTVTAAWNGNAMTEVGFGDSANSLETHTFHLSNVTGATGNLVLTKSNAGDDAAIFDCAGAKVTGLTVKAIDVATVQSNGASTTYSTVGAATGTANEGLVAFMATDDNTGSVTVGTWGNSFTRMTNGGNASGVCCVFDTGQRVVSSTGTYTGQTTGNTSHTSIGAILTFK